jgi:hypothetical protein
MLAVWLDDAPSASKDQRDPDGWTTGAARTDFLATRLAELAHAPVVDIRWLNGDAASWWSRIEQGRRRKLSKERSTEAADRVIPLLTIPPEIEEEGKRAGYERIYSKGRTR